MTAGDIDRALRAAIEAAAVSGARTRKLSGEALIRFLIAAEGGSLAKELHYVLSFDAIIWKLTCQC